MIPFKDRLDYCDARPFLSHSHQTIIFIFLYYYLFYSISYTFLEAIRSRPEKGRIWNKRNQTRDMPTDNKLQ